MSHIEPGSWADYEVHGRKRLLPVLGSIPLGRLDESAIQELVDVMAEEIEAGKLAPKTAPQPPKKTCSGFRLVDIHMCIRGLADRFVTRTIDRRGAALPREESWD